MVEDRVEAELELGRQAALIPELEALVAQHPLRERLRAQLMLALYRSGRQADALATYRDARDHLVGELGLEPGKELRALEQAVLQQDEALELRRIEGDAEAEPPRDASGWAPPRRRRWTLAGALAVIGVAVGTVLVLVQDGGRSSGRDASRTSRLHAIDSRSGAALVAADLPGSPADVAFGMGSVWVAEPDGGRITRIDPRSGTATDRIQVADQPGHVTVGGGAVWVASALSDRITRIDPNSDMVTQTIRFGGVRASDVAFAAGGVWVADSGVHGLTEIDPTTGAVRRRLGLDVAPAAIAVDQDTIWVASYEAGVVEQLDRRSGSVINTIPVGQGPGAIAVGRDAVWVANSLDATVSRIDPATGSVRATIPVPSAPSALAALPDSVWVASPDAGILTDLDPRRNAIVSSQRLGGRPQAVAAAGDRVWIASAASAESHRGGTLTLVWTGRFASTDPAFVVESDRQFTRLAYDTLVTYQASAGAAGLRLLPDLAVAVPRPADGGTVYRFRLRPDIRYSDGRPMRARDFRRAIERLFRVGSTGASYYTGLIGGRACIRRPRACRLPRGVETDDAARTVVFRLRAPDPDFLAKLTVLGFSTPIPPGVPDHDVGTKSIPSTGPYRLAAGAPDEVRFVRNRYFREWSASAQPAGNPDAIVWRTAPSSRAAVRDVETGRADWLFDPPPPAALRTLQVRHPSQLHVSPAPSVQFIHLNTRRPPFDDVRVRRALNYAIHRSRIATWNGGALVARPLCQPLAPGLPGFRRYCPYTRHPRADGRWSGPHAERARQLVAASGTRGDRVDVWAASDFGVPAQVPRHVTRVMRSLGYRARLHLVPSADITLAMRRNFQLSVDGNWAPDYPSPSAYLPQFFGCRGGNSNGYFCDPMLDRRMARASTLQLSDPRPRRVALGGHRPPARRPSRLGPDGQRAGGRVRLGTLRHYEYSPVGGFIAHQAWLR